MVDFMLLPASVYPEVINGVEQPSGVINLCWFREALAARLGGLGVCHRGPVPGLLQGGRIHNKLSPQMLTYHGLPWWAKLLFWAALRGCIS